MEETINPLLQGLKLPGRIFQLPSKGVFYHNGELAPDVKEGEVHVHPMSALDEINMKNPDQLFNGAAVETVFKRCVTGVLKPTALLAKDVDAIMLFLRTVTYGPEFEFIANHRCISPKLNPETKEPVLDEGKNPIMIAGKDHSYIADIDAMINGMKLIDATVVDQLNTVHLLNGQVVKLRPNRYSHVLELIKANENKQEVTVTDQQENLIMLLMGVLESVDSITNPEHLREWLSVLPSPFVNKIAEKIAGVNSWGSDHHTTCKCKDCGAEFTVEVPINPVSFFTE
jgi:hypothetical protein